MQVNDSYFIEFNPADPIKNIGKHPDFDKFKKIRNRVVKIAFAQWQDGTYIAYPDNTAVVMSNGVLSVDTINSLSAFTIYISKTWEVSCISTGGDLPCKVIMEVISPIARDCLYQHHSGDLYKVISFSNMTATKAGWVKTVTYRSLATGEIFSRPLDEFSKSFKPI